MNILSGIIEKVSGERADLFIKRKLFDHLEISDFKWDVDQAGHAFGMCGLHIRANDLIKLGELMMHRGMWKGIKLISEEWVDLSLKLSVDLSDSMVARFDGCGDLWWMNSEEPSCYTAAGMFGQYCAVFPDLGVVAVRLHDYRRHSSIADIHDQVKYRDFFNDVRMFIQEASK